MDNTFIKIGRVIKADSDARISYHPLLSVRNLAKSNKKGVLIPLSTIATHELLMDIDNNILVFEETDVIIEKLRVIEYKLGETSNNGLLCLIGNYVIGLSPKKKNKLKLSDEVKNQFSFKKFVEKYQKNYPEILNSTSFIVKYRNLLNANLDKIIDSILKYDDNSEISKIAFIIKIKYNNEIKFAHEFTECLDEIDEMFLSASYVKDKGFIFRNAFYTMFNYGKFETKGVHTMYEGSIPYYNKEDFLSLYYARSIYNEMSFFVNSNYSISIFPNYDGLTIEDIEDLIFKRKDIFNFNKICNEIQNFINNKVERNPKEKILIPLMLKFDIYYRYKLGQAGNQNMLRLTGVRYTQLLKIRDHINNEYYPKYKEKESGKLVKKPFYWILTDLYQDYNGKSDRYMTTIIHTLQNIYQEKYAVPQAAEFCLLDRTEHVARNGKRKEFKKIWNNLFNIFKFLKTMENQNFVSELTANPSYKLGVELAKFEAGWKKGRDNLKKTIEKFTGNISRTVYSVEDIRDYYTDLIERMKRNKVLYGDHNDLLFYLHTITDNEFDKRAFIMGYFTEKNRYKDESTESAGTVTAKNDGLSEIDEIN